ncbi:hypothetical protein M153_2810009794 [Pseudoloma neurophilia]|uniref:Uncharacterized protein n=1 Tax=Pseudoloma neurophilia TaxID=146866 RepID=A0A0R0LYH2_9MICR|nr:hypothetical protein M153_2810009794 [Pseudoloma neurophilia]
MFFFYLLQFFCADNQETKNPINNDETQELTQLIQKMRKLKERFIDSRQKTIELTRLWKENSANKEFLKKFEEAAEELTAASDQLSEIREQIHNFFEDDDPNSSNPIKSDDQQ